MRFRFLLSFLALALLTPGLWAKETRSTDQTIRDGLSVIPAEASGFLVINDHQQIEKKVQKLDQKLKSFSIENYQHRWLKQVINQGWIPSFEPKTGSVMTVFMEPNESEPPVAIWMIPTENYEQFLKERSVSKQDGKIAHIKSGDNNRPLLAASKGKFALIAEAKDKSSLQKVLDSKEQLGSSLQIDPKWLAQWDVAGVATQKGWTRHLSRWLWAESLDRSNRESEPGFRGRIARLKTMINDNLASLAIAGRLTENSDVKIGARIFYTKDGRLAKVAKNVSEPKLDLLTGLPNKPYLLTGASNMPEKLELEFTDLFEDLVAFVLKQQGAEQQEEQVRQLLNGFADLQRQSDSFQFMVHAPDAKEAREFRVLFSGQMQVKDGEEYLKKLEQWITAVAKFAQEQSSEQRVKAKREEVTVNGNSGVKLTWQEEESIVMLMVASKGNRVTLAGTRGSDAAKQAEETVRLYQSKPTSIYRNTMLQSTVDLLPKKAHEVHLIDVYSLLQLMFTGSRKQVGYPPVGISTTYTSDGIEMTAAIPFDLLQAQDKEQSRKPERNRPMPPPPPREKDDE